MGIPKRKVCLQYDSLFAFTSAIMIFALLMCVAVAMAKDQAWEDYKLEYNKHYTAEEEPIRYANWQKEVAEVELHNAMNGEDLAPHLLQRAPRCPRGAARPPDRGSPQPQGQ